MSKHLSYAVVSGGLVASAWAFLTPLSAYGYGTVEQVGGGFVLGFLMYSLIAVLHYVDKSRASS